MSALPTRLKNGNGSQIFRSIARKISGVARPVSLPIVEEPTLAAGGDSKSLPRQREDRRAG
ncbi:MAG: hypothetical protein L5655_10745 [Thermosediminibacteraceae bacterium]|nr:hypothetical protein [Thermosediminibacteraceae bacterium]